MIPPRSHFLSFLFLLRLCAFKLSSGVRRGWGKGECDFLLTARRERTKGTKGKGAGIASVYYSSPVLSRSVWMYNTEWLDPLSCTISRYILQWPQPVYKPSEKSTTLCHWNFPSGKQQSDHISLSYDTVLLCFHMKTQVKTLEEGHCKEPQCQKPQIQGQQTQHPFIFTPAEPNPIK